MEKQAEYWWVRQGDALMIALLVPVVGFGGHLAMLAGSPSLRDWERYEEEGYRKVAPVKPPTREEVAAAKVALAS